MILARLLLAHAIITAAAGIVLLTMPGLIPSAVGIELPSDANLICHLLAAAELAMAVLSYTARTLRDVAALRVVSGTIITFHAVSAAVELAAAALGPSPAIWANIALRVGVVALFVRFGLQRRKARGST